MPKSNPYEAPKAAVSTEREAKRPALGTGRVGLFWGLMFGSYFLGRALYLFFLAAHRGHPFRGTLANMLIGVASYFFLAFLLAGWAYDKGRLARPLLRLLVASVILWLLALMIALILGALVVRHVFHAGSMPINMVVADLISDPKVRWTMLIEWGPMLLMGFVIRWRTAPKLNAPIADIG